MRVERTDFISVPVTDMERSKRFYGETLGLEQTSDGGFPEYRLGENVTLYLVDMASMGSEFSGPHSAYIALRVPDVAETRAELEGQGIVFAGETRSDARLPHGVLPGPRRERADAAPPLRRDLGMTTITREQAATRFAELPLPSTSDEHWRFTDLRGFEGASNGHGGGKAPVASGTAMLELDVAGRAVVTENGIEIVSAPDGVTFELLPADYPSKLIPDDDKFALENLARWEHGLLVRVPKNVVLTKPLYVQVTSNGGSLYWRMVVIAEEGASFSLIEDLSSATPETVAYTNAVVELFVEPAAKIEYVSLQNLSQETWHFGRHKAWLERDSELDWVIGGFGSKRGKVWIENDLAGPGATSRVTGAYFADGDQHLDYDTFQEHIAPNTESDFAFKGALRERASAVWRGHDPRRGARAEDERVPGEPQPAAFGHRACRFDPGPRDHGERRALHARRDAREGQPRGALLPDGPGPVAGRGRAADRARLLPGRARPDRARAGARGARRRAGSPNSAVSLA